MEEIIADRQARMRARAEKKEAPKKKPTTTPRTSATPKSRTKAPPTNVNPGWIHEALAAKILSGIQKRISNETGRPFDIGEVPDSGSLAKEGGIIDDREPVELLSRVLAHAFYRIPGLRNIEKKLEGNASNTGIGSDIAAFFTQLYTRNEETFDNVRNSVIQQARASREASSNGGAR
jgi:hypothetical protein